MKISRLSVKDSIRQWVDKINKALDLPNVDGSFTIDKDEWTTTTLSVSGGIARSGTILLEIPPSSLTLPLVSNVVVGINTASSKLEWYTSNNIPNSSFIPIYLVKTNNTRIVEVRDARTWAYESPS